MIIASKILGVIEILVYNFEHYFCHKIYKQENIFINAFFQILGKLTLERDILNKYCKCLEKT